MLPDLKPCSGPRSTPKLIRTIRGDFVRFSSLVAHCESHCLESIQLTVGTDAMSRTP